jgi:toxin ParE1/3/4
LGRIVKRAAAKRDLVIHFAFVGERSLPAAERFLQAAQQSFEEIARMPFIGSPGKVSGHRFSGIRMWRVRGFERYLIFYLPLSGGVAIHRVIHAAQDYTQILKK